MLDWTRFWDESMSTESGATPTEIAAWEEDHGVTFPKLLQEVYRQHNGGVVRNTELELMPLSQIVPPDDEFWEYAFYEDDSETDPIADRSKLLILGWDQCGGQYFLNYNELENDGDEDLSPSVWRYYGDPGDLNRVGSSVVQYFQPLIATSGHPDVDWQEAQGQPIVAEEVIDEAYWMQPGSKTKFLLVESNHQFTLYTHSINLDPDERQEVLGKMVLPKPLEPDAMSIARRHQDGTGPWTLHLEPRDSSGILYRESKWISDTEWKNSESHGVPIYTFIESESEERLRALRRSLVGAAAAEQREADDVIERDLARKMESVSDDDARIMGLQLLRGMQLASALEAPSGAVPPEIEPLARQMAQMMEQMQSELESKIGDHPVSPEVAALIESLSKKLPNPK